MTAILVPPTVKGNTVTLDLVVTDVDGVAVPDLADRALLVQVRATVDSATALYDSSRDGGLTLTDAEHAEVRVVIPAGITAAIPGSRSVWDLRTEKGDGTVETFFYGSALQWVEPVTR